MKEDHDDQYYNKCFYEQVLGPLNQLDVVRELYDLTKSQRICLICYEKPGDFCHRHLVATWLNLYLFNVEEMKL